MKNMFIDSSIFCWKFCLGGYIKSEFKRNTRKFRNLWSKFQYFKWKP